MRAILDFLVSYFIDDGDTQSIEWMSEQQKSNMKEEILVQDRKMAKKRNAFFSLSLAKI